MPGLSGPHHATFLFSSRTWISFFFFLSPPTASQGPAANPKVVFPKQVGEEDVVGSEAREERGTLSDVNVFSALSLSGWLSSYGGLIMRRLPFSFFSSSLLNCLSGRLSHLVTPPVSASSSEVEPRLSAQCHLLSGSRAAAVALAPYGMRRLKVVTTAGCPVCPTKRI